MNNLLKIVGITKSFNGSVCLDNVSFTIHKADFLLIAGSNGSGKTLLMKHLNGLYPIKKGTLFYRGEDCYKKENLMKSRIGIVFQNPDTQIIGLTVADDIGFGPSNLGLNKEEKTKRVNSALKRMSIEHLRDRNPHTLSGGEKKRVTIAGVLAMHPEIIIFDEPFIGLDYPGVIDVTKSLLQLKEEGETVIIITHDLEKIAAYCNRGIILSKGIIVKEGSIPDIIDSVEDWGIRKPVQSNISDMTWLK